MYDLIHNFAAQKRKIDANLEQAADVLPNAVGGSGEPRSDEGLEVQAIVILGSPEMGLDDKPTQKNVTLVESRKASPVPTAIQVVRLAKRAISQSDRANYTRAGRRRPFIPDHILLNSYLPPRGPTPPMEEVSIPRPEGVQEIIDR